MDEAPPVPARRVSPLAVPYATWAIVAASVMIFVARLAEPDPWSWESLGRWGVGSAYDVYEGAWWSLLASCLVHVNWIHIGFNVYWLWILGRVAERTIGTVKYAAFFVVTAFVSSAAQLAFADDAGVGLSGALYAVAGFMWFARARYRPFRATMTPETLKFFVGWALLCVVTTWMGIMNIANAAHIGGFVMGGVIGRATLPDRRVGWTAGAVALVLAAAVSIYKAPWSSQWNAIQASRDCDTDDLDSAYEHASIAIRLDPEYAFPYRQRGWISVQRGDYEAAIDDLTKAIEFGANTSYAHALRGLCYRRLDRFGESLKDLNTALSLDADRDWAYEERAWVLISLEKYKDALPDFDKAIRFDPESATNFGGRGHVYRKTGRRREAMEDLKRSIELDETYAFGHIEIAWIRHDERAYLAAIRSCNKALAINPTEPHALGLRGMARHRWNDIAAAITDLKAAIELAPDDVRYRIELYNIQDTAGNTAEAISVLESAVERGIADAEAYYHLAWLRMSSESAGLLNRARAIDYAREATRLEPNNGAYWSTLASAYDRSFARRACLDALEKSLALDTDPAMYGWIVWMLEHWDDDVVDPDSLRYVRDLVELIVTKAKNENLKRSVSDAADLAGLSGR